MSLASLSNLAPEKVYAVLSEAASMEMPKIEDIGPAYPKEVAAVFDEIRDNLKIRHNDISARAQSLIRDALSRIIVERVTSPEAIAKALERAGQAGRLPTHAYKVEFPLDFLDQFRLLGVDRAIIEAAVRNADHVEHLWTDSDTEEDQKTYSLFLKSGLYRKKTGSNHTLLVQTGRRATALVVQAAWWILPNELDLTEAATPLEILQEFVKRYGVTIEIAGERDRFILEKKLLKTPGQATFQYQLKFVMQPNFPWFASVSHRTRPEWSHAIVGIAYAINLSAYRMNLLMNNII
jgi:hypothetical protein